MNSKKREKPCFTDNLPQDQSALAVTTRNFFVLLKALSMEAESTPNSWDAVAPQGSNKKSEGPFPFCQHNFPPNCCQTYFKGSVLLRTTETGSRIVTDPMVDCKIIPSHLSEHILHHFTFYLQSDRLHQSSSSCTSY
jgi:hypothetical protein